MFLPIMRNQENNKASANKEIIEIHVAVNQYYNYSERIMKKYYNKSPLHNRNNVKSNRDINELPEGRFTLTIRDNFI